MSEFTAQFDPATGELLVDGDISGQQLAQLQRDVQEAGYEVGSTQVSGTLHIGAR